MTGGTPATLAAKRATATIPIVFRAAGDPILLGIVTSLARPGGNVTGFSLSGPEASTKQLTILKELPAGIRRIGVLEVSTNPYFRAPRPQFEQVCRSLGLEPIFVQIAAAGEIDSAISSLARQRAQAVVLRGDSLVDDHRLEFTGAARRCGDSVDRCDVRLWALRSHTKQPQLRPLICRYRSSLERATESGRAATPSRTTCYRAPCTGHLHTFPATPC